MSLKNRDEHNRWRNKTVAFRVSPEEWEQIERYVVDKNGNIVGQPIVGAITSSSQAKQLNKLIDEAIENSKK